MGTIQSADCDRVPFLCAHTARKQILNYRLWNSVAQFHLIFCWIPHYTTHTHETVEYAVAENFSHCGLIWSHVCSMWKLTFLPKRRLKKVKQIHSVRKARVLISILQGKETNRLVYQCETKTDSVDAILLRLLEMAHKSDSGFFFPAKAKTEIWSVKILYFPYIAFSGTWPWKKCVPWVHR